MATSKTHTPPLLPARETITLTLAHCDVLPRFKKLAVEHPAKLREHHFKVASRRLWPKYPLVWYRHDLNDENTAWQEIKCDRAEIDRRNARRTGDPTAQIFHVAPDKLIQRVPVPQEVDGTHYQQGIKTSPWDLQRGMASTGDVFLDGRRCDIVKYVSRIKGTGDQRKPKMLSDLRKAAHCLHAAIACGSGDGE